MKLLATVAAITLLTSVCASAQEKKPDPKEALKNPASLKEKAPEKFSVKFETSKGDFVIDVTRAWSPNGADRFYNLAKNGSQTSSSKPPIEAARRLAWQWVS